MNGALCSLAAPGEDHDKASKLFAEGTMPCGDPMLEHMVNLILWESSL